MACKLKNEILKDLREAKVPKSDMKLADSILNKLRDMEINKPESYTLGSSRRMTVEELAEDMDRIESQTATLGRYVWDNKNGKWLDTGSTVTATWVDKTEDGYTLTYKARGKEKTVALNNEGVSKNAKYRIEELDTYYEALRTIASKEDMKTKVNFDSYKQLEQDIHGNPEKMVDLMEKLDEIEGNRTDPEHIKYLKELIGSMDPKFFTNMKTYVKEKAKETGGVVTTTSIGIGINPIGNPGENSQTAAEVYAHEIVHAYTRFAVKMARDGDQKAREILRQLEATMLRAKEDTKWQDLLGKSETEATEVEKTNAREMYDYMFDSKFAEDEFMAHVLTNPLVMKKMKRVKLHENKADTVWGKIKEMFDGLVGYLLGEYKFKNRTKDVYSITAELAMKFAEMNNKAVNKARAKSNIVDRLTEWVNDLDEDASEVLRKAINKVSPTSEGLGEVPADKLGKTKWYAKALGKMIFNPEHRRLLMTYLDKLGLDLRGSIPSIINDLIEQDDVQKAVDWLALKSDKIDQNRMNIITTAKGLIKNGFKRKLLKEEEEALTEILIDSDMQSVVSMYGLKKLRRMLIDSDALEKEIGHAKHKLKELDRKNYYWHVNQASGLGYFMATGKAHIRQNMNTKNIALGTLSEQRKRPWVKDKGDLEQLIDAVATLTSLKYMSKRNKEIVVELILNENSGVKNVLDYAKFNNEEAKRTTFKGEETMMVKGYSKVLSDGNVEIEIAPVSSKTEMEHRGFTLVSELDNHSMVSTKEKYAIYKMSMFGMQNWQRTATRLTKNHRKGTTIKDLYYSENDALAKKKHLINVKKINIEGLKLVKQMKEGELNVEDIEYGLSPIVDPYGEITTYRYMMEKGIKKDLIKQDTKVSEVLAATRATMVDKMESIAHNEKILELIKEDAETNYIPGQSIGKDGVPYLLVGEDSTDSLVQDLWKMLPKEFKAEAKRNRDGVLPIRKDLVNNLFGYRHLTFANFPGLEKIMPQVLQNAIRIAETIWMEFIKITKVDILIKMPFVLVGNIVSNMVYALTTGSNPVELLGMYRESLRDVRSYLKVHKEWVKLKEIEGIGKLKTGEAKRIKLLEQQMENNPIHEMYKKGMYQAIVEDASQEELSATNGLKKWYNEKTEKMPKLMKDGLNWVYLTEETQYYKFMTEVLQISDLIARDVEKKKVDKVIRLQMNGGKKLPNWYIEVLKTGTDEMARSLRLRKDISDRSRKMSVEERKYFAKKANEHKWTYLLNAFVNYNKSSGPVEEYLNKMGFIMFTKYAKRIQRVIAETGVNHPLKSLLTLFVDNLVVDMDTIQDQSIFTRSWYNLQPQYPWDRVMDVMTPPILQPTTYRIF